MSDQTTGSSKFSLGLILGALSGALAAFLLAPASGEENRKKAKIALQKAKNMLDEGTADDAVKAMFGEVSAEGARLLSETKIALTTKVDELKDQLEDFDKVKFTKFVTETVQSVNEQVKAGSGYVEKLTAALLEKWEPEERKSAKAKKVLKPKIKVEKLDTISES
jgi:gas vesicle protein